MLKIAITGNIASGKSQVEKILEDLNFNVIDTDKINHHLLFNDETTKQEIKLAFKNYDIEVNGSLAKEKLGNIVFNNKEEKEKLEKILHKKIFEKIENYYNENSEKELIFVSVPLLFEAKWEERFDKIIFVSADENIRLKRLMKRNNLSETQAKARINSQEKEINKIEKSDFVIYNNSDLTSLKNQTKLIINKLTNY